MSTLFQIRKIHTLKNILGLDDETYRKKLESFGVYSSKNLTETEADIFIEILNEAIKIDMKKYPKKYDDLIGRDEIMATPSQLRKIEVVWSKLYDKSKDKKVRARALRCFLRKHFGVFDIRFLTKERARQIIPILEIWKKEKELKAV